MVKEVFRNCGLEPPLTVLNPLFGLKKKTLKHDVDPQKKKKLNSPQEDLFFLFLKDFSLKFTPTP